MGAVTAASYVKNLPLYDSASEQPTSLPIILKPNIGYWAPFDHNALIPTCSSSSSTFLLLHGSSAANPNSGSLSSTSSPPCGTCIYKCAQWDDWIIRLAQFAVEQHNHKESKHLRYVRVVGVSHTTVSSLLYHITLEAVNVNKPKIYHAIVWMQILKNFMELLVWNPVNDSLWTLGVKSAKVVAEGNLDVPKGLCSVTIH
ncbi:hypothetical protein M0R45_020435 [Rubus argutus]|uniref:Cysteine proteinase inhibitor n=1 Tax=Rubus argutus TaxID=59490 RepID=A0AAW1X957_RUBAR